MNNMENLEQRVPAVVSNPIGISYDETKLLDSYMNVDPESVYECNTCNNCGSGDCGSCCSSTDD
jgi:hypothetical protein